MTAKALPAHAIAFHNLVVKVDELSKKALSIEMEVIQEELKAITKTSSDSKVIDSAIQVVVNKYYVEFKILYDEIIQLLDSIKPLFHAQYMVAFRHVYDEVSLVLADGRFHVQHDDEGPSPYINESVRNSPAFICITSLNSTLAEKIFFPLTNSLLVGRADEFDTAFDLPKTFEAIKEYIVKGLYELEQLLEEKSKKLTYYNIPRAIERFNTLRNKEENSSKQSLAQLDKFCSTVYEFNEWIDDSEVTDDEEVDTDTLYKMWNEIRSFSFYMEHLFTPEEFKSISKSFSVLDILDMNTPESFERGKSSFTKKLSPEKATFILAMLEDLGITVKGKAEVGERHKSALRGVVEAALEKNILPPKGINASCVLIASQIGLELKAKLNFTATSKSYHKKALRYIEQHYKTV